MSAQPHFEIFAERSGRADDIRESCSMSESYILNWCASDKRRSARDSFLLAALRLEAVGYSHAHGVSVEHRHGSMGDSAAFLRGIFCFDYFIGPADERVDFAVGDIAVKVELRPVFKALIQRVAHRQSIHPELLYLIGSRFYGYRGKVIHIRETEHVVKLIEHEYGLIAPCKFAEGCFFGDALHAQAIFSKLFDIHCNSFISGLISIR